MTPIQLDFFKTEPTDLEILIEEDRNLKLQIDKLRRSFFARHTEMCKIIFDLQREVEELKRGKSGR